MGNNIFKVFFFFLISFYSYGQVKGIDELKSDVIKAKSQEQKIDAINELGNFWFSTNYDSAKVYYEKAYNLSKKNNYKKGIFEYSSNYGNVCLYEGNYKELIKLMQISIKNAVKFKDKHNEAKFTANLGNAYMSNGEYEKALKYYQRGIDLFNKNKEYDFERKINLMISVCFSNSENQLKAIEYSKKSIVQSRKANDSVTLQNALEITGSNYLEKEDFTSAKPYLTESLLIATKHKLPAKIANCNYYLSRVCLAENNFSEAEKLNTKALQYFTETGNTFYKVNSLVQQSKIFQKIKNYPKAVELIKEAEKLALENNMRSHLEYIYQNMSESFEKINNYKEAYKYQKKYTSITDSINSAKLKTQLQTLDTKYQTEKKNLQIQNLQTQSKKRFWISIALALGIIGVGGIAYSQFKNYKTKKALLLVEQDKAVAEERLRIATDMHDDVGTGLSRIRYISNAVKTGETSKEEGLSKVTEISDDTITKMSEIIWALNESNQTLEELIYFIRSQASEMVENAKLNFEGMLPETIPNLSFGWMRNRNTYLLAKETLNNAIKHAQARTISIQFEINDQLIITIKDDGIGFDTTKKFSGNGLNNYKKRIEKLGGTHTITSSENTGTTVVYRIPLA